MDDKALYDRVYEGLLGFYRFLAESSPSAYVWERDEVLALVSPGAPERSFCNAVLYSDPEALAAALPDLERVFADAGTVAWTVWVDEHDTDTAALLARAGHALDADPSAMAVELDRIETEPTEGVDIRSGASAAEVAAINDAAYGYDGDFADMIASFPEGNYEMYTAWVDGKACACTGAFRHGDNCDISLVATLPEARGRGLASALMTRALADARGDGCRTTTLIATSLGEPIYLRLGYRALGTVQMWERRKL